MAGGSLSGKVIVVTGAGRGIGREIALLAAREGAKVVVNDLGGSAEGEGASAAPAQEVVDEIRHNGGEAVANFDSVAEPGPAANIIKTALDAFGRVDGVVNNAGILRDRIFHRMSVVDFELVIKVHLLGSFYVSHAAARHFREPESGAFVHFTSTSGLVGKIAPVVAYLLSDAAKDVSGQIFAVRMNEVFLMSQSRPVRSVHRGEGWTCRSLAEHGIPALKGSFVPLDRSGDVFNWDAV